MPSKVVPEVAVPLSASTECTVFQIFLKMSDPWKETSVRASLRCVRALVGCPPVSTLVLPHSSCVCLCGGLDECLPKAPVFLVWPARPNFCGNK